MTAMPKVQATGGSAGRSQRRLEDRRQKRAIAEAIIRKVDPALFDSVRLTFDQARLEPIEKALDAAVEKIGKGLGRDVLNRILEKGAEEHGWQVLAWPSTIINVRPAANPFTNKLLHAARVFSRIEGLHRTSLDRESASPVGGGEVTTEESAIRAGQLLFSAIADGGLSVRSCINNFHKAVSAPLWLHGSVMWFDFETPLPDESKGRPWLRRWMPDPMTAALILRWRLDGCQWPYTAVQPLSPAKVLESYLSSIGFQIRRQNIYQSVETQRCKKPDSEKAKKQNEFFLDWGDIESGVRSVEREPFYKSTMNLIVDGSRLRFRLKLPQILADFATTENYSCSLPIEAWLRTLTGKRVPTKEKTSAKEESECKKTFSDAFKTTEARWRRSDQRPLLRKLKQCLGNKDNSKVTNTIALERLEELKPEFEDGACGVLRDLLLWVKWCVEARDIAGGVLLPTSTLRYLNYFSKALLGVAGDLNWRGLAEEEFIAIYANMLSSFNNGTDRALALEHVTEFHQFLAMTYGLPPLAFAKNGTPASAPHANIITEVEFRQILQAIRREAVEPEAADIAECLATIGYRLGLRRDEAAGRVLQDISGFAWQEQLISTARGHLSVHATDKSSVKFHASRRRLPLDPLIPSSERRTVDDFFAFRREHLNGPLESELVFTSEGRTRIKITTGDAFEALSDVIRKVTGDPLAHFHHLRHSFVSLTLARLLAAGIVVQDGDPRPVLPVSWQQASDRDIEKASRLIFGQRGERQALAGTPLRESAFLVAMLAGHVDPGETVQTYTHVFDWLLYRYLTQDSRPVSQNLLARLLDINRSAAGVWRLRQKKSARRSSDVSSPVTPGDAGAEQTFSAEILAVVDVLGTRLRKKHPEAFALLPAAQPLSVVTDDIQRNTASRPLRHLSLHEVHAFSKRLRYGMLNDALSSAYRLDSVDAQCLAKSFYVIADRESLHRIRSKRRPRFRRNRSQYFDGDSVAANVSAAYDYSLPLPMDKDELKEAAACFRLMMELGEDDQDVFKALTIINKRVSQSNSELYFGDFQSLEKAVQLFDRIAINRGRLSISIHSWHEEQDPSVVQDELARRLDLDFFQVAVQTPLKRSRNKPGFGQISLRVKTVGIGSTGSRKTRASHGWKVACYYAEAVFDACTTAPQARAERGSVAAR